MNNVNTFRSKIYFTEEKIALTEQLESKNNPDPNSVKVNE